MRADQNGTLTLSERVIEMLFAFKKDPFTDHLRMIGKKHQLNHAPPQIDKTCLDDPFFFFLGKTVTERDVDRFLGNGAFGSDKEKPDSNDKIGDALDDAVGQATKQTAKKIKSVAGKVSFNSFMIDLTHKAQLGGKLP